MKRRIFFIIVIGLGFAASGTYKAYSQDGFPRTRLATQAGWCYRFAGVDSEEEDYVKDHLQGLRSGIGYGGGITYFFLDKYGLGLNYYQFRARNSTEIPMEYNGTTSYVECEDLIDISFAGPTFSWRSIEEWSKFSFIFTLGVGYVGYRDDVKDVDRYQFKGNTIGVFFDTSIDYALSRVLSIGISAAGYHAYLSRYDKIDSSGNTSKVELEDDVREGLGFLSFSAGIRVYL